MERLAQLVRKKVYPPSAKLNLPFAAFWLGYVVLVGIFFTFLLN